jgi:hypothetical protein
MRNGIRWQTVDIPKTLIPKDGRHQGHKRTPTRSHNPQEAKLSLNHKERSNWLHEKQLACQTPNPLFLKTPPCSPVSSCFPAHRETEVHTRPFSATCYPMPWNAGEIHTLAQEDHSTLLLHGGKKAHTHWPCSPIPPAGALLGIWKPRPLHKQALDPAASGVPEGKPTGFVLPYPTAVFPAQYQEAHAFAQAGTGPCCPVGMRRHKPTGFVAPWLPSNLLLQESTATCKQTPLSMLCYFVGARRPASRCLEAHHSPLCLPESPIP